MAKFCGSETLLISGVMLDFVPGTTSTPIETFPLGSVQCAESIVKGMEADPPASAVVRGIGAIVSPAPPVMSERVSSISGRGCAFGRRRGEGFGVLIGPPWPGQ